MKRLYQIALTLLLLACMLAFGAACSKDGVDSITIRTNDRPRVTYVVGQELDLSDGYLTVIKGRTTEEIPLTTPGVTVSGYNKDVLGEQALTVSYMGQETVLRVTVVARISAENYTQSYFVGQSFDASRGRLIVYADDGTSSNVDLDDERVSVEGFDSSAAGTCVLTAHYRTQEAEYSGTFSVEIVAIESIELTRPNKISYKSHEGGLDLAGGYLTVRGGSLVQYVELTEEMVTGFDLSVVSLENRGTPVKQTLTVHYAGREFPFEVTLEYSDVSLIRLRGSELSSLSWSGSAIPAITEEQGAHAIEAAQLYFKLPTSDRGLITRDEALAVMRTASAYGYGLWAESAYAYADTVIFSGGEFVVIGKTYEKTKSDYTALQDTTQAFYTLGALLDEIKGLFGNGYTLVGSVTFAQYLDAVYDPMRMNEVLYQIDYILDLYEYLQTVPENWTTSSLSAYSEAITSAMSRIRNGGYSNRLLYGSLHLAVSSWRASGDFFRILYEYYLYVAPNEEQVAYLKDVCLPEPLEELYSCLLNSYYEVIYISQAASNRSVYDASRLQYYFARAEEITAQVLASDDALILDLYHTMLFPEFSQVVEAEEGGSFALISLVIKRANNGYLSVLGRFFDDPTLTDFREQYYLLARKADGNDAYLASEEFRSEAAALFECFFLLTPAQQNGFLFSLHATYTSSIPGQALYYGSGAYNLFAQMLQAYYESVLPASARSVAQSLFAAAECYSLLDQDSNAMTAFLSEISLAEMLYGMLTDADRATFDVHLGDVYERYTALAALYNSATGAQVSKPAVPAAWQERYAEVEQAIYELYVVTTSSAHANRYNNAALVYAFEYARTLADALLAEAPIEVYNAFSYAETSLIPGRSESLDRLLNSYRATRYNLYINATNYWVSVEFGSPRLSAYYLAAWKVYRPYCLWDGVDTYSYDAADIAALTAAHRALTATEKRYIGLLDRSGTQAPCQIYAAVLRDYFAKQLTSGAAAAAESILAAEIAYISYLFDEAEEALAQFLTAAEAMQTAYAALTEGERAELAACYGTAYTYYLDLHTQLSAQE